MRLSGAKGGRPPGLGESPRNVPERLIMNQMLRFKYATMRDFLGAVREVSVSQAST